MFVKTKSGVLVNLYLAEQIYIENNIEKETCHVFTIYADINENRFILGKYETCKEAKDKFENIITGLKEKWEVLEL